MENPRIDQIIRSRRKTVALVITPDAKLVVRAPMRTPDEFIRNLVQEKRAWIQKKIAEISQKPVPGHRTFADGDEFLFLGKTCLLHTSIDHGRGITLESTPDGGTRLCAPQKPGPEIKELLYAWYIAQAKIILRDRCSAWSGIIGKSPASIRVSGAKKRWGSCSTNGTVSFSWRLVLAPPEIIDYVIVHELVHLLHHNHSKRFWETVRHHMPDYRQRKEWLSLHERVLVL